jgi:SAM-dependent methyltransferase
MSDWQERITRETAPAIRAEHDLRYRVAAQLIRGADSWADLGCGTGLGAADALGAERPAHVVLADIEEHAVARAAEELGPPNATQVVGDLTDPEDLQRIGEALLNPGGEPVVTCFEVIEHLSSFLALLEWSNGLVQEHRATFVLSVPNDAFWSIRNPHHLTAWGEGAFEELRRLLPAEQTVLRQVALSGSAFTSWDSTSRREDLAVEVGGEGTVATHFIVAFGSRHDELGHGGLVVQTDTLEQRRWERQRENDMALMQKVAREHKAEVEGLDVTILEQREELRERTTWFEEWRTYIHELERELGRPLSGVSPDQLPEPQPPSAGRAEPDRQRPSERSEPPA